jgi:hypothetical protein
MLLSTKEYFYKESIYYLSMIIQNKNMVKAVFVMISALKIVHTVFAVYTFHLYLLFFI